MQDHVSRLVGLDGFEVKRVVEAGDRLDLEVELDARAAGDRLDGRDCTAVLRSRPRAGDVEVTRARGQLLMPLRRSVDGFPAGVVTAGRQ